MNIKNSGGRTLTNLRFADDVLLVAHSKADIFKMLSDFAANAELYGLKLNFDITKVIMWDHNMYKDRRIRPTTLPGAMA